MSEPSEPGAPATSFGQAADQYQQGRPTYPAQAVEWLLEGCQEVADVGAGTGKLTAVIAALGRDVVAIDPDPAMLARLRVALPDVPTLEGRGEAIPLPAASRDAITFAQAWHWVDAQAASLEAARVLRPGGRLGLIWNVRDESVPWIARLGQIFHRFRGADVVTSSWRPPVGPPFGTLQRRQWRWEAVLDREEVESMVASRSHVIALAPEQRAALIDEVRALLVEPGVARPDGRFALAYRTDAYRAALNAGGGN